MLRAPQWDDMPRLAHGFCGRRGGCSRGPFAELNLSFGVGDDAEAVRENWRRVSQATGAAIRFATMRQVHGTRLVTVRHAAKERVEADALVTRESGVAVSILTADCVPILFVAPERHAVAAVHAGWRGTIGGIAAHTVRHLERRLGASVHTLRAALGPSIGGCCYEVDRDIVDRLEERWGVIPDAVRRDRVGDTPGAKAMLDLRCANAAILVRAGMRPANIVSIGACTGCATTEYFSYRAATAAAGDGVTGRQLSFIGWRA
jgi:YfiH family protein